MNTIKMLLISSFNSEISDTNGVSKKLALEIKTFSKFGYDVDYTEISMNGVYVNSNENRRFITAWKNSYHNTFISFYKEMSILNLNYDVIYFRYEHISLSMLSFFKVFKKIKGRLVIGELPTYMGKPYKQSSFKNKMKFYFKRAMNNFLPKKIDYLVTFSEHEKLFRIKTINIENFTAIEDLKLKSLRSKSKAECHLLVLAQFTPAHGIDLAIRGISEYYKTKKNIQSYLHIVGNGDIKHELKQLVNELKVEDKVMFHGALGGAELDHIFEKCDIGIGALAIFRKGSSKLSELKIREYTARGLPFVYNAHEPQIEGQFFCKKLDFSEKPINVDEIVDFYLGFDYCKDSILKMRSFAEENFSSEIQLAVVHKKIKEYFDK